MFYSKKIVHRKGRKGREGKTSTRKSNDVIGKHRNFSGTVTNILCDKSFAKERF